MAVKSIFDIKCFKDVKFWFYIKYIEIRKHFLKYHIPTCASKSFCMYMCYHILHIVWKWLAGAPGGGGGGGGGRCSAAQKPRALVHKMPFSTE